jgi:hypothetical protein
MYRHHTLLCTLALLLACGGDDPAPGREQPDAHVHEHDDAGAHAMHDASTADIPCSDDIPPVEPGREQLGKEGRIRARLLEADPAMPRKGENDWKVLFSTPDGEPITDLSVTRAWTFMPVPTHNHSGKFEPEASALEQAGEWSFAGFNFTMRGPWEVRFDLASETAGDDYVVFEVCVGQ